jgi:hypothetical protein
MLALPVYSKAQEKIIGVLQVINKIPEQFSNMSEGDAKMLENKPVFSKVDEDSAYLLVSQIAVSVENCNKLSKLLTIKEMTEGRKRQAGRGRTGHPTIGDDVAVQKLVKGSLTPSSKSEDVDDESSAEAFREANPYLPKPMPRECTAMINREGHMEVSAYRAFCVLILSDGLCFACLFCCASSSSAGFPRRSLSFTEVQ